MLTERRLSIPGPAEYRAAMVLAFLAGRKTQVRLPVHFGHQSDAHEVRDDVKPMGSLWLFACDEAQAREDHTFSCVVRCPFGVPGDGLWIPETWGVSPLRSSSEPALPGEKIIYFASDDLLPLNKQFIGHRRPWNHMPRRACRLTRRVADVRIERVKEIGPAGAIAEGCPSQPNDCPMCTGGVCSRHQPPLGIFKALWNARYAGTPFAWSENPMVWVGTLEPEGA